MWDEGKIIVILICTRIEFFFVGDVNDTIAALTDILTKNNQWTDYMEEILQIIANNYDGDTQS